MKPELTDEERAARLQADKEARRQRNPLKSGNGTRTTGSQKAVTDYKQPVRTPNGPCRDKDQR